jgi:hypothetical protein
MGEYGVAGRWSAIQSNGYRADFSIVQPRIRDADSEAITWGDELMGVASHSGGTVKGDGTGSVVGRRFHFRVEWDNDTIGVYDGTFDADGFVTGTTFDERHPSSRATWRSNVDFDR